MYPLKFEFVPGGFYPSLQARWHNVRAHRLSEGRYTWALDESREHPSHLTSVRFTLPVETTSIFFITFFLLTEEHRVLYKDRCHTPQGVGTGTYPLGTHPCSLIPLC